MGENPDRRGSDRPAAASTTFADHTKEIARRNEEAHKEAAKARAVSGRAARAAMRERDAR